MNAKEQPIRIPLQQQVEELLERTKAMATWGNAPVDTDTVLHLAQRLRQALDTLYIQFQRYKDAAMLCPQDGKTGPCTFQKKDDGLRYCFKCSSLHPEDANKEHHNDLFAIENYDRCLREADDIAMLMVRAAAGVEDWQWVAVLASEVHARLLDETKKKEV